MTQFMALRDYQREALRLIAEHYEKKSKRCALVAPGGSGKTVIFCEVLKRAYAKKKHALFVVRGRKLVNQASKRLAREDVPHSVIMASDKRFDPDANIHVASIDTLYARKITPKADIIVIDEAHLALSPAFDWLLSQYPDAYLLPVTATFFHKRGFRHMADAIIEPVTVKDLIGRGYLCPARYYVPSEPDLSTVKKSNGDYIVKDLAQVMDQARLFGPVVESYKKLGEGRPALLFAVNVAHSKRLCAAFNDAGIPSLHIDASHSDEERDEAIRRLEDGSIKVLTNCAVLGVGVDIPRVGAVILCRPTLSYPLYIQLVCRGSRIHESKKDFLVLDFANCVLGHGMYETHRQGSLDGKQPLVRLELYACKQCYFVFRRTGHDACPGLLADGSICGAPIPRPKPKRSEIKHDESRELTAISPEELERRQREEWIRKTAIDAAQRGYKPAYVFIQAQKRYGREQAKIVWKIVKEIYA